MRAVVDQNTCTGCGLCPEICPAVFELEASGLAHAKVDPVPPEEEDLAREAAASCPVDAIKVE